VFTLSDYTGQYSPPTGQILFRKWIGATYAEISDDWWDVGWTSSQWLILNDLYQLAVKGASAPFRVIGPLETYAVYDRPVQITTPDLPTQYSLAAQIQWVAWRYSTSTVKIYYYDNLDNTITANVKVYDLENNLMFNTQPDNSNFLASWAGADPSKGYNAVLTITHSNFGSFSATYPIGQAAGTYLIPGSGVDNSISTQLDLPPGLPLMSIVSAVIVTAVGLAFSSVTAQLAMIGMVLTAAGLWAFGWLPGNVYTLILLAFLSVVFALGRRRFR
jgi:hypothetical protein